MYSTHATNNVNAKNTRILSVHSRRPYFFSNRLECKMVPAVFCSSSFVPSTLADDETSVSRVIALFCVVSDKCRDMANIFSVTLSCWNTKLVLLCLAVPRFRTSPVLENSSCLSNFSISIMVLMLARRNACSVLKRLRNGTPNEWPRSFMHLAIDIAYRENCWRCESTSPDISGSLASAA